MMKFIILGAIILGFFGFKQFTSPKTPLPIPKQQSLPTPTAQEPKTFKSEFMKFTVVLSTNFKANENIGSVIISNSDGQIYIDRNGTNFNNIEDYLDDLSKKNRFTLRERRNLKINNLSVISGKVDQELNYFIYADNWIYTLTTNSENLYDVLDQIAQSFRYTP